MPEIKSFWVQTAPARLPDFPGAAEPAFYFVTDGLLTMCSETGRPVGKPYRLEEGDNERVVAARLKLEAWRKETGSSDFNRRLNYRPLGIA